MKKIILPLLCASLAQPAFAGTECTRERGDVRISAVGDILVHEALFRSSVAHPQRFKSLWKDLTPLLQSADLTIGNLEGPVAPGVLAGGRATKDVGFTYDGKVYSGTNFVFNYHPALLDDLASSGFDLLTTANNHSMDRGSLGVDRTVEQLKMRSSLSFVGMRTRGSDESFAKVVNAGGIRLGVISCTESTNGIPDKHNQVMDCFGKGDPVAALIGQLKGRVDAVAVFPHWGVEYKLKPSGAQTAAARRWVQAGALLIVGNHPHVLQTVEWIPRSEGGKALVVYSLGNFVSWQGALEKRTSAVAHIDLRRTGGGVAISQFSYTPIFRLSGPQTLIRLDKVKESSGARNYVERQMGQPVCN